MPLNINTTNLDGGQEKFSLRIPISKSDHEKGTVTGWASISSVDGTPIIDHHNEIFLVKDLSEAAHKLVIKGGAGKAGDMHGSRVGDLVESMVFDAEKAKALGLGDGSVEGWAVTLKLRNPESIKMVKEGKRRELSIHGLARKTIVGKRGSDVIRALSDMVIDEVSIVDEGASGNDKITPRIVIAKLKKLFSKQESKKMNLEEVLAAMPEEQRNVVLAALEELKTPAPVVAPVVNVEPPTPAIEPKPEEEAAKALEEEEVKKDRSRLAVLEAKEEMREFVEKAEKMKFIPGMKTEDRAKVLCAVSKKLSKDEFAVIEKSMISAAKAIEDSDLFKNLGSSSDDDGGDTAFGQLETIAKARKIPLKQACDENPKLYDQHREESKER